MRLVSLLFAVAALIAGAPSSAQATTVLLMHPGGFIFGGSENEAYAEVAAQRAGLRFVNVAYPLSDLPAASLAVEEAAREASRHGSVVAYGDSAGGSLAARLAQRGLVCRAAAYSPVVDVPKFLQPLGVSAPMMKATPAQFRSASPDRHTSRRPVTEYIGRDDDLAHSELAWADSDQLVHATVVSGGHLGDAPGPGYRQVVRGALHWLTKANHCKEDS